MFHLWARQKESHITAAPEENFKKNLQAVRKTLNVPCIGGAAVNL